MHIILSRQKGQNKTIELFGNTVLGGRQMEGCGCLEALAVPVVGDRICPTRTTAFVS